MNDRLRNYIEEIFQDAPATKKTVEVKEEILQNLCDKYNDLIAEGKSEEAAYNIAVAGIGDVSELIKELKGGPEAARQEAQNEEQRQKNRQKNALLTSAAIGLYIICVVPLFIFQNEVGLILMFMLIAAATALLIYNGMTKPQMDKIDATMAEEFKQWRESNSDKKRTFKSITSAVWALTVVVYIILSFTTHAWHITWVVFLIAGAIINIIKAIFDLKQ